MEDARKPPKLHTRIWREEAEPDNSFVARSAHCHGYDVYGDMLGRAGFIDMVFLLFRGEAPTRAESSMLDALAMALANPGPREASVHAAMCAGAGGSTAAASLMAALAVGAGQHGGAREVFTVIGQWSRCASNLAAWREALQVRASEVATIWPDSGHAPGFDPHAAGPSTIVDQTLAHLAAASTGWRLRWLAQHRSQLEEVTGRSLAFTGVAAAALADLGFDARQGEMLYLMLRLPGAAAHALEQGSLGHKSFPFFSLELLDDPAQDTP